VDISQRQRALATAKGPEDGRLAAWSATVPEESGITSLLVRFEPRKATQLQFRCCCGSPWILKVNFSAPKVTRTTVDPRSAARTFCRRAAKAQDGGLQAVLRARGIRVQSWSSTGCPGPPEWTRARYATTIDKVSAPPTAPPTRKPRSRTARDGRGAGCRRRSRRSAARRRRAARWPRPAAGPPR
jgi:hypothetical protein